MAHLDDTPAPLSMLKFAAPPERELPLLREQTHAVHDLAIVAKQEQALHRRLQLSTPDEFPERKISKDGDI